MLLIFLTTLLVVNCVSKKPQTDTSHDASDSSSSVLLTHPRIMDNCLVRPQGREGAAIKGFQLQKVFIATTPGLQTPRVPNRQSPSFDPDEHSHFCIFSDPAKVYKPEPVQSYLKTLEIKEKLPGKAIKSGFKIFYSQPETKHCKSQSLSSFGVSQLINLGKYLLLSYFGKLKSLDSILLYPGFAATFGDESLFHSLHALLFGMLTEKQFVHMHVDKLSSKLSRAARLTDNYEDLHYFVEQAFLKESHLFKEAKVFTFSSSNLIENFFGPRISAKDIIGHLSNTLCSKYSDMPVKTVDITYKDVSNIFNTSDLYNRYLTTSSMFRTYAVTRTSTLRQLVKDWLTPSTSRDKQTIATNRDLKIITIDDLFMLSFLTAINVSVTQHIAPSSRLIFESFKPLFAGPVFPIVHSHSGLLRGVNKSSQASQEQHRRAPNHGPQDLLVNEERLSEKQDVSGSLEFINPRGNVRSEEKLQNSVPISSRSSSEKTNDDLKLATSKSPPFYIRVIYNGQVVTSHVPGCETDPMISVGLCSVETVDILLGLTQWRQYPLREEL